MYIHTCLDIYTCKYLYIYIPIHIRASIYATDLFQTPKSEFMVFVNPPVMSWHKGLLERYRKMICRMFALRHTFGAIMLLAYLVEALWFPGHTCRTVILLSQDLNTFIYIYYYKLIFTYHLLALSAKTMVFVQNRVLSSTTWISKWVDQKPGFPTLVPSLLILEAILAVLKPCIYFSIYSAIHYCATNQLGQHFEFSASWDAIRNAELRPPRHRSWK